MKVTYTQNRFEIDGIEVINPEVINICLADLVAKGISIRFDLPANIIAEKEMGSLSSPQVFVYRLKLKESIEYVISRPVEGGIIETRMDASNKNKVETQEEIFDDMFCMYFDLRDELKLSGYEACKKIQERFIITRK